MRGDDRGQVSVFLTLVVVALIAVAGLVLDGGLALSAKVAALEAAQSAARAGAQEIDLVLFRTRGLARLDPARATASARGWLAAADATGQVQATESTVTVTVEDTTDTQLLRLVGLAHLRVSATATATAVQGVTAPGQVSAAEGEEPRP